MTLEGVISILEGMNPRMLETKLRGFLQGAPGKRRSKRNETQEARVRGAFGALAGVLRRLYYLVVRFLRRPLCLFQVDHKKMSALGSAIEHAFQELGVMQDHGPGSVNAAAGGFPGGPY